MALHITAVRSRLNPAFDAGGHATAATSGWLGQRRHEAEAGMRWPSPAVNSNLSGGPDRHLLLAHVTMPTPQQRRVAAALTDSPLSAHRLQAFSRFVLWL